MKRILFIVVLVAAVAVISAAVVIGILGNASSDAAETASAVIGTDREVLLNNGDEAMEYLADHLTAQTEYVMASTWSDGETIELYGVNCYLVSHQSVGESDKGIREFAVSPYGDIFEKQGSVYKSVEPE